MKKPLVSVIMSVYREPINYLTLSINSILNQTLKNFEFIIVNDNPGDKNLDKFLEHFANKDKRIKIIKNNKNLGLAKSLNKALQMVSGDYIARMDADDISLPTRLEKQVNFLEKNKNISLCGTGVIFIDENDKKIGKVIYPNTKNQLEYLFGQKIIPHPTWMFRKVIIKKIRGYRNFKYAQDVDFLVRLILSGFYVSNLEELLLQYRIYKNKDPIKNIFQIKTSFYIRKFVINFKIFERKADLLINNKLKIPSNFFLNLHKISMRLHYKAIELKLKNNKIFYFLLSLLSAILSLYQFLYFYSKVYFKLIIKVKKCEIKIPKQ